MKYVNDENNPQDNEQGKRFTINIGFGTELETSRIATEYITNLAATSSEIVDDETSDHNLRYIGANPNNYVEFNNELWRIIGVMNDVADESGTIEPRIKLIRSESIGSYSWDNKGSYGSNNWTDSELMKLLNEGAYYNKTNGNCSYGVNGATTGCDFNEIGLGSELKYNISKVIWKLGGDDTATKTTSDYYDMERGIKSI